MTLIILLALLLAGIGLGAALRSKNMHIWMPSYVLARLKKRERPVRGRPIDIMFCVADHYEPKQIEEDEQWQRYTTNTYEDETFVVDEWLRRYPGLAVGHCDSDGIPPRHSWFVPVENYDAAHWEKLTTLCRAGFGEVEIHLHHFRDTEDGFRKAMELGKEQLAQHGARVLSAVRSAQAYAFVHGNWSLDNAGGDEVCGVNNELEVLSQTGCFADFTLPCAPNRAQTRKINAIYYATDDISAPKSHDSGVDVVVGGKPQGTLMIIQGPLCLDWSNRKFGVLPRTDNGELTPGNPVTANRIQRWLRHAIHVKRKPNWIFIKVHCHGGVREHLDFFLGSPAHEMYSELERELRDTQGYRLHYVTAREMYNIIKAAEAGQDGNPNDFRDFEVPPYANPVPRH